MTGPKCSTGLNGRGEVSRTIPLGWSLEDRHDCCQTAFTYIVRSVFANFIHDAQEIIIDLFDLDCLALFRSQSKYRILLFLLVLFL